MKIAVMTDTDSGITEEIGKRDGIFVLPMPVMINGELFLEGKGLDVKEYYKQLENGVDSSTSQPSPESLTQKWDEIFELGYDEIVYIPLSSGLSSSCATAALFAEDYDGRVQVVDNHSLSVTLMDSAYSALRLAQKGMNAKEIKAVLDEHAFNQIIYITMYDMTRLVKGGRVTPAGAAIAKALNLKPILKIQGDKLDAFAKVRGMKKGEHVMIETVEKDLKTRFADFPKDKLRIKLAHSCADDSIAEQWRQQVQAAFPEFEVELWPLSCSLAAHIGHGSLGIGLYAVE